MVVVKELEPIVLLPLFSWFFYTANEKNNLGQGGSSDK
jgi:hypothetical protein